MDNGGRWYPGAEQPSELDLQYVRLVGLFSEEFGDDATDEETSVGRMLQGLAIDCYDNSGNPKVYRYAFHGVEFDASDSEGANDMLARFGRTLGFECNADGQHLIRQACPLTVAGIRDFCKIHLLLWECSPADELGVLKTIRDHTEPERSVTAESIATGVAAPTLVVADSVHLQGVQPEMLAVPVPGVPRGDFVSEWPGRLSRIIHRAESYDNKHWNSDAGS